MIREDSIPALWMASGSALQPVCEHPHEPHSVDAAAVSLPRRTHDEELYLVRAARLVAIAEGSVLPASPRRSTRSAAPQLVECIRTYWRDSTTPPLQRVADPSDSSQQRWMCAAHAKAMLQATALNLYLHPGAPGFTRFLRLGLGMANTANALAFHLGERKRLLCRTA